MRISKLIAAGLLLALVSTSTPVAGAEPTAASERDKRMNWFRDARFGLFIHWGVYAVPAGEWEGKTNYGEWFLEETKVPVSRYEQFAGQFNPVKFDAKAWVRMAKDAGMKYIVITSKHHDGFGIFKSDQTDWSIKRTPFQRDPLKELADACKGSGVRLCFYHSIMDWHHPAYAPRRAWNDTATGQPDMDKYVEYMKAELKELLTRYGPIGILWFDGEWENTWTHERGVDLYNYVRGLQPDIIVNNRVGKARGGMGGMDQGAEKVGDYGTPEQEIPATGFGPGVDWESCMTMNNHWGYNKNDDHWKSTETLARNLIDCASKGGNYLLNVGPTAEGTFPQASIDRLAAIGKWMNVNSEAIYGTSASPFKRLPWGRCTVKAGKNETTLFLHVFDWPANGELIVPGLKSPPSKAFLLSRKGRALKTQPTSEGLKVLLPASAPDAISSTVVITMKGTPQIEPQILSQAADGSVALPASEAEPHGNNIRYESGAGHDNLGYWTNPADWASWTFNVKSGGSFEISAEIAAPKAASFEVIVGGQKRKCDAPVTGDYGQYQRSSHGFIRIPQTGAVTLEVRPVQDGWNPINLKNLRLKPVPAYQ